MKIHFKLSIIALIAIIGCGLVIWLFFFQLTPFLQIKTLQEKNIKHIKKDKQMLWKIKSSVFKQGEFIPKRFTKDGENISPPLFWSSPPEGTKALALIVEDPDAPLGVFTHWIIYNISPNIKELPINIPKKEKIESLGGAKQGRNDFGNIGYEGPSPPFGSPHRYIFKLYALKEKLELPLKVKRKKFLEAVKKKQIQVTELIGKYKR